MLCARAGTAPRAGIGWGGQTRSTRAGPGEERPPRPPGNILAFRGVPRFVWVSRVLLATTFVTPKFPPSPSRLPLPPSLGEATPEGGGTGRQGPTPRVTWSGSRGVPRGAGRRGEGARQPMGQGGGAGAVARGCARAAAARRGGAGRGWAWPCLAWPVLVCCSVDSARVRGLGRGYPASSPPTRPRGWRRAGWFQARPLKRVSSSR